MSESLYEFFVSYSGHDADYARAVAEALTRLGVPNWMAESEILVEGRKRVEDEQVLRRILEDAIAASRRCLLILSPHTRESLWVMNDEFPPFREREAVGRQKVIWPVVIGSDGAVVRQDWASEFPELPFELSGIFDAGRLAMRLCQAAGVAIRAQDERIPRESSRRIISTFTVNTEHRKFAFHLTIPDDWVPGKLTQPGMVLNIANPPTGLRLNVIVGAMPRQYSPKEGRSQVEEANYFAEPFIARRMEWRQMWQEAAAAPQKERTGALKRLLKFGLQTAMAGRPEVLGSHILNVAAHPHFAYTYRMVPAIGQAFIARKYSVILTPPGADRYFEFVFTAAYPGTYPDFLARIGRIDDMIRSFRFAE